MTQESLWRKAGTCLAAGATITLLGASALASANAVDTSGVVASQAVIQTVNDTTDAQLSAESIVMNTVFSNGGSVKATITYKVPNDRADAVKQIVEPKNGVGTMETSTDGGSTVYTVTIEGATPQDFQQKFVKSDSTPNGYLPGAKFEFMIGEGFGLRPQYAFLIDAPFTSNWFKDGVTGEYTSTFDVPWLNSVKKSYKDSSTGQNYLQPSSAEVDGRKLAVSDPDGVTASDAKPSEHIQFVASGPLRTQLIVLGAIVIIALLLVLGLIAFLRKRNKKSQVAEPASAVDGSAMWKPADNKDSSYAPVDDSQPVTRPIKIVPTTASADSFDEAQPATDQTAAFAFRASESELNSTSNQYASSNSAAQTSASATKPQYDYQRQQWVNTDGWGWDGDEWVKKPEYDYSAQKWTGTDGWKWDGADWRREPHYNHTEGAWKGTEGWNWTGNDWQLK